MTIVSYLSCLDCVYAKGGTGGNGGFAYVCRDQEGKVTEAKFYDYYVGRILGENIYLPGNTVKDKIISRLESIKRISSDFWQYLDYIYRNHNIKKFLDDSSSANNIQLKNKIQEARDQGPILPQVQISVAPGCGFETVAYRYKENGIINYDLKEDIYEKFSSDDKAGLFLHEIFYAYYIQYHLSMYKVPTELENFFYPERYVSQEKLGSYGVQLFTRYLSQSNHFDLLSFTDFTQNSPDASEFGIYELVSNCESALYIQTGSTVELRSDADLEKYGFGSLRGTLDFAKKRFFRAFETIEDRFIIMDEEGCLVY